MWWIYLEVANYEGSEKYHISVAISARVFLERNLRMTLSDPRDLKRPCRTPVTLSDPCDL